LNKHLVLKQSVIAVAMTLGVSQVAMAQAAATTAATQTVYVTGSNLKRSDKEGNAPVQVITAKDIKDTGAQTVAELLKQVPSMGTDTNQDFEAGSGFARGVATASLRGLSSSSTLVLLNGRRMTPSAYADPNNGNSTLYDLNSIPVSALDRVEILKDGASAIYGSDAIGGVINFITKSNYRGAEGAVRAGANDDGNFGRKGANIFAGAGDIEEDGWNVFVAADHNRRDRVARRDAVNDIHQEEYKLLNGRYRSNYSSSISRFPTYYRERTPGSANFGQTLAGSQTGVIFNTSCAAADQITGGTKDGILTNSILFGRTFCNYNADQFLETQGDSNDSSVMSRGVLKLGSNVRAFAEASYARSERDYTGAPITLGQTSVTNFTSTGVAAPFQAVLPIGHPDNPFPTARASVGYRFENLRGGSNVVNQSYRFLAGLNGTNFNWDWETGVLWNRSNRDEISYGRLYLPTLRKLNTGTSLAQLAADPTIGRDVQNEGTAEILQIDARATHEFSQFKLRGGNVSMAVGGEVRQEKIKITPDEYIARGDIYGLANTIIDGKRDVKSMFTEARFPVLKNLEIELAGRYDKYESLKGNFVPRIGARWEAMPGLVFRSTYSEGFRAPALSQVTPGGAQFFLSGLYDPKRCEVDESTPKPGATTADCNKSASGSGGANPDLKPETAKSFNLGLVFSPTSNIDFVLDYYRIKKVGEVALGSETDALKNEDRQPQNVVRDTTPANLLRDAAGNPIPGTGPLLSVKLPWTNQGSIQVSGIDAEIRYRMKLGTMGNLSTRLSTTYQRSYELAETDGAPTNNVVGGRAGIYDWILNSGANLPKWKTQIGLNWERDVHAVNASMNYIGKVSLLRVVEGDETYAQPFCYYGTAKPTDAKPNRSTTTPLYEQYNPDCAVKSWTTFGLGYTYTGIKNLSLNINIQNILDTKAPYDPAATATGYTTSMHNAYGRYFNVSARYKF
jgi:iron complex outermembrane receptor protein